MTLTLAIRNMDRLDNGMPAEFVLNRRGAMIGRAATCDWSLPDPRNYISSRHGEVMFRDGFYYFKDVSTNGTFLNGAGDRMAEPRRIEQGDLFLIGHYEMVAHLTGDALVAQERQEEQAANEAQRQGGWGWDAAAGGAPPPPPPAPDRGGWGEPANNGLSSGAGSAAAPLDGGWGGAGPSDSGWGTSAAPADSGWGAAPTPSNDGWGPAPTPSAPEPASWAPQTGPSLSAPAPYAARGDAVPAPPPPSAPMDSANSWAPAPRAAEERAPSPWDSAQAPVQQSSAWSSAVSDRPKSASPNDIWGSMESSNVVDWARADFGQKVQQNADPLGLNKQASAALPRELPRASGFASDPAPPAPAASAGGDWSPQPAAPAAGGWANTTPATPPEAGGWSAEPAPAPTAPPVAARPAPAAPPLRPASTPATPAPPAQPDLSQIAIAFAVAAGLKPDQLKQPDAATLERAGALMRRLISGLVVMVEARARAKSQMGAEQTGLEFDGNNPIKFARTPDQALAQLLNPPERGFMSADKAVEDAYFDLQSHQMATLKAMQGALRATLDRFSPAAIKKRAETGGFLSRLLPGGREATLWQTYEREFSGVAQGSDEAFMDVFAKEFRQAYDEQSRNRKR
jgi:type VI secretion system FHA domain protein